jgi:hypothetical protein
LPPRGAFFNKQFNLTPQEALTVAVTFIDVQKYMVYLYGGAAPPSDAQAIIRLDFPNIYAYFIFVREGGALQPNKITISGAWKIFHLYYRAASYAGVIDILRNEKPVKFFFDDSSLFGYVGTGDEPVGEAEMV